MITHLSGMDCTLKTTLCGLLSKQLDCKVVHFDKPKDLLDGKKQYFDFLSNLEINEDVICDRFHDGEHIYAPIYRGYESDYLQEFEAELRKYPYLFVNTKASLDVIKERIKNRGEDFVKEEHYSTVLNLFNRFVNIQSMPYIIVDTSEADIETYMQRILEAIEKAKNIYQYCVKNDCKTIYYGNMEADNFIIVSKENLESAKKQLTKYSDYQNCWITTNCDRNFVDYQIKLLKPKEVIYYGGTK